MRPLYRSATGLALLAVLAVGCGSTANDELILQFIQFDTTSLVQKDQVTPGGAVVDDQQDTCNAGAPEPFTPTTINAVFRNQEAADILLQGYQVDAGPNSGLGGNDGIRTRTLSQTIPGGRCSNSVTTPCATFEDCQANANGTVAGTCVQTETLVPNLTLFDIDDKMHINPAIQNQAINVTITFFGTDLAGGSLQVSTGYLVTFTDLDNCTATGTL